MSDDHHLVGLDDLFLEEVHKLQVLLLCHRHHGLQEDVIVGLRQRDPGEQVGHDALEERDVVGQELGQVHINDGSQQLNTWIINNLLLPLMIKNAYLL